MKTDEALLKMEAPVMQPDNDIKPSNDSKETIGYSDGENSALANNGGNADSKDGNADSNVGNANSNTRKDEEMEKIKSEMNIVFGQKNSDSKKAFVDSNVDVFQKGDHVLVVGIKRKLPAVLGDRIPSDESDGEDYVEVNFFNKTKDRGWQMLDVVHVVKMSEVEKKIAPPRIVNVSRT